MTNGQNVARVRHLEALATATKRYTLQEILDVAEAVAAELESGATDFTDTTSISGGLSGLVPAPQAGDESKFLRGDGSWATGQSGGSSSAVSSVNVLSTVASTVDGGLWYEVINGTLVRKLRNGNYKYSFAHDKLTYVGDASNAFISYLPFTSPPIDDALGNTWTASVNPTISGGKLYLDGTNYLVNSTIASEIGAQPWTIDFWATAQNTNQHCMFFGTYNTLYGTSGAGAHYLITLNWGNGVINLVLHNDDSSLNAGLTEKTRHHYDGTNIRVFVDGALGLTKELFVTLGGDFVIGRSGNFNFSYPGYIDHFRIFKGVALRMSDFTPPTETDYD